MASESLEQPEGQSSMGRHLAPIIVFLTALGLAFGGSVYFVNSWNDGSRLATVESLVDRGTFAIDGSIFVVEYPAGHPLSTQTDDPAIVHKTRDKLYIDGQYYSDKSPVPAVLLAGVYELLKVTTGLTAREHPKAFIYWMSFFGAGLWYFAAVMAVFGIGRVAGMSPWISVALAASFGLATTAWPYSRQVNNHIMLLGSTAWMCWALLRIGKCREDGDRPPTWLFAFAGFVGGLGYTIDLGTGPVLLACAGVLVLYRGASIRTVLAFGLGVLPWLAFHHGLNYHIAGTLGPANANPAYFDYPDSMFNAENMTGNWNHESVPEFLTYALELLFGIRGFFLSNLPLFCFLTGGVMLLWVPGRFKPEVIFACCAAGGTWLLYAALSTNYSGHCRSIRWFVPLLAPAYLVIALFYQRFPSFRWTLWWLSLVGGVMGCLMWYHGPWQAKMVFGFWVLQVVALLGWAAGLYHWRRGAFTPSDGSK